MKVCPKCGKKWPQTGKFCPMDGTPLVAEVEEEPDVRPTRILGPDELPKVVERSADVGAAATQTKTKASASRATVATEAEPPSESKPEKPAAPASPAPPPVAPVNTTPPPPKAPVPVESSTPPARPEQPTPKARPPAEPDRMGTFSETKWFMIGEHIKDEEVEASDLPVEDLQEIYKRTGVLPEEVRKKYSLRYGTDEERSSGEGSGKKK